MFVAITIGWPRPESHAATTGRRTANSELESRETAGSESELRRQVVFLLHGIGKGRTDMLAMRSMLRKHGYEVVNWRYPSTKMSLDEIAELLHEEVSKYSEQDVSFVTHSMGGIVVRTYLKNHRPQHLGRVVLIAPPNKGAYLADLLGDWLPYKLILGPAGQQLRQGDQGGCAGAGVPCCEFGIIAGGSGRSRGMNPLIPGDNDGTVSVESTQLEGASDFLVLPYAHPVIQMMPRTGKNVISFLLTGKFADENKVRLPATDTTATVEMVGSVSVPDQSRR